MMLRAAGRRLVAARRLSELLTVALLLLLAQMMAVTPAVAAPAKACRVTDLDSAQTYSRLQPAVEAAKPHARLVVRGTCRGGTLIDADLSIVGTPTVRSGKPTLAGTRDGSVLTVQHSAVVIKNLTVEGGRVQWTAPKPRYAGGIANLDGTLTLRDVVVRRNRGMKGGGIYNSGTLMLTGATVVTENRAGRHAAIHNDGMLIIGGTTRVTRNLGGIFNRGTLTLRGDSRVDHNRAWQGDGAIVNIGSFTMDDASSVRGNGDLGVDNTGTLTLNGASSIIGNWNGVDTSGTLTMNDRSRISRNALSGISNSIGGVVMNDDTQINGNGRYRGLAGYYTTGGVVNYGGALTLNDQARVIRNRNWGVYNHHGGTLTMTDTSRISGNRGLGKRGGGVHEGTLTGVTCGSGGNVNGNTPDDCHVE